MKQIIVKKKIQLWEWHNSFFHLCWSNVIWLQNNLVTNFIQLHHILI